MKNVVIPEVEFRKDFEHIGFEIVSIEDLFNSQSRSRLSSAHRLNFYLFLFITHGTGQHFIDFDLLDYREGSLIFVGKNQVHSWIVNNNVRGSIVFFTERFLFNNQIRFDDLTYGYPYNSDLYGQHIDTQTHGIQVVIARLMDLIHEEWSISDRSPHEGILQCLLRILILKIQPIKEELDEHNTGLEQTFIEFQKLLDLKTNSTRNVLDYCQLMGISYHVLNKAVKAFTQKTSKAFIDDNLILKSKRLLAQRTMNTSQIAYELGFEDPSNFTKYFKKHTGNSPKHFLSEL